MIVARKGLKKVRGAGDNDVWRRVVAHEMKVEPLILSDYAYIRRHMSKSLRTCLIKMQIVLPNQPGRQGVG